MFVARPVVARQRQPGAIERHVSDAAREVGVVLDVLALVDLESRFVSGLAGGLERPLSVDGRPGRLLGLARAGIGDELADGAERFELFVRIKTGSHAVPESCWSVN